MRRMAVLAVVVSLVVACTTFVGAPASAAGTAYVRGMVVCQSGQAVRTPVYVEAAGGARHVAGVQGSPSAHVAYYALGLPTTSFPASFRVHVGCGSVTASSPWRKLDGMEEGLTSTRGVLNVFCSGSSCRFPKAAAPAQRNTTNWFPPYQCTYGSATKFMSATAHTQSAASIGATRSGYVPRISGDAHVWNDQAAAAGWDVVSKNPAPRSVVVFEPGVNGASSRGHNGFVTAVDVRSDGVWVTYTDMNGGPTTDGSDPSYTVRRRRHVAGMSYILVPPPGWNA